MLLPAFGFFFGKAARHSDTHPREQIAGGQAVRVFRQISGLVKSGPRYLWANCVASLRIVTVHRVNLLE